MTKIMTPLPDSKALFLATYLNPVKPITLADLDADCDLSPLDQAIENAMPALCERVEFKDDNGKRGYRALEYTVRFVARHEWDEDGCSPVIAQESIAVKVTPSMSIEQIVKVACSEIKALIHS